MLNEKNGCESTFFDVNIVTKTLIIQTKPIPMKKQRILNFILVGVSIFIIIVFLLGVLK